MIRKGLAQGVVAVVLAVLSCGVSLVLTIRLCQEVRGADGDWLTTAIGCTWELGKCFFASVGLGLAAYGRGVERLGGFVVFLLAGVLVVGSVAASLAYMVELDGDTRAAASLQAARQQDVAARLAVLDGQMTTLAAVAADDQRRQYRQRALAALRSLDELRQQRAALAEELSRLLRNRLRPGNGASGLAGLAGLLGGDAVNGRGESLRLWVYGILAAALELVGIAAIAIARHSLGTDRAASRASRATAVAPASSETGCAIRANSAHGAGTTSTVSTNDGLLHGAVSTNSAHEASTTSTVSTNDATGPSTNSTVSTADANHGTGAGAAWSCASSASRDTAPLDITSAGSDSPYAIARDLILRGELRPTYRGLRERLQLGQETAQSIMHALVDAGVVVKRGRRYVGRRGIGASSSPGQVAGVPHAAAAVRTEPAAQPAAS